MTQKENHARRFVFIDALRGIAAVAVVFHHLLNSTEFEPVLRGQFPHWFAWFCDNGAYGVQIFFVISGFVIAHSLRNIILSRQAVGNFILRRQFRLDPPYWCMLGIALLLETIKLHLPGFFHQPLPEFPVVVANLFYLQKILHTKVILDVSWTLCLEIQFYLVFIGLLVLLSGTNAIPRVSNRTAIAFTAMALGSLLSTFWLRDSPWFFTYWFYFAAGVLTYWAIRKQIPAVLQLTFLTTFTLWALWQKQSPMIVGASTTWMIYFVGCRGHLEDYLNQRLLQYLGKISYSIYLVHVLVVKDVLRFGWRHTGTRPGPAIGWFVIAFAIVMFLAHLFYRCVEQPSLRWAGRFKQVPVSRDATQLPDKSDEPAIVASRPE